MKKIIPAILILALLAAMTVTAFATSISDTETGNSQEVLASYEEGTQDKTIISVDISWNQMSFTYKGASEPVWDASEHKYVGEATEACWAASDATITITNHSNTILQSIISYEPESAFSGISMLYTDAAPYIGSAYTSDTEAGTPCSVTVKAIPEGALPADTVDNTRIGIITVKVTSEIDMAAAYDDIAARTGLYVGKNYDDLSRGEVCFAPDADVTGLQNLLDTTAEIIYDAEKTNAEKNLALNDLITAYYGALEIKQ